MIVGLLGGRAAEEIMFDSVTTGASNDIEKATKIARAMVTQYGMSERFGLMGLETVESRYLDGRASMNCADTTAAGVDDEVKNILKDCYEEAKKLLSENKEVMDKLAGFLIERETITGKEFMKIFREVKGIPEPEEEKKESGEKIEAVKTETAEQNGSEAVKKVETNNSNSENGLDDEDLKSLDVDGDEKKPVSEKETYRDPNWRPQPNPYENGVYTGERGQFSQAPSDIYPPLKEKDEQNRQ